MVMPILAKTVLPVIVKAAIERATDRNTADRIEATIAADPKVVNELSAEAPYQSRVAVGAVVGALGVLVPIVSPVFGVETSTERVLEVGGAIMTLAGAGYTLYGRFASGLAPLFDESGWLGRMMHRG